jgi:hypothetical protein
MLLMQEKTKENNQEEIVQKVKKKKKRVLFIHKISHSSSEHTESLLSYSKFIVLHVCL